MDGTLRLRHPPAPAAAMTPRAQSGAEELANAASHALGCIFALLAWPLLAPIVQAHPAPAGRLAVGLFCATMVLQYAASAACHACPPGRLKAALRRLDHAAIFVFIAGSITPFALGPASGAGGAAACALVWTLALAGAALKLRRGLADRRLSTGVYLLLGVVALLAAWPALRLLDAGVLAWLAGGIAAYLVGTGFFLADSALRYGHFVWHLCVLAGSASHLVAALQTVHPGAA
jgi:hemolysin III